MARVTRRVRSPLASITAVAAVIAAILVMKLRGAVDAERGNVLPVAVARLPDGTVAVERRRLGIALSDGELSGADVPEQARWSYFAERYCGGYDVYRAAMDVAQSWRQLPTLLRHLAAPPDVMRATLQCGRALAKRAGVDEHTLWWQPGQDDQPQRFGLVSLGTAPRPDGHRVRDTDALAPFVDGACSSPWTLRDEAKCGEAAEASGRLPDEAFWVHGEMDRLGPLAAAWPSRDSGSLPRELLGELAASHAADLAVLLCLDARRCFPPPSLLVGAISKELTASREELDHVLRWGVHAAVLTDRIEAARGEVRVEWIVKGDAEASRLSKAIERYRDALVEAATARERRYDTKGPRVLQDFARTRNGARLRAWKKATLVRDGMHLVWTARLELDDRESVVADRYRAWRRGHALAAAQIVTDLVAGQTPPAEIWMQLRGDELARRVREGYKPFFAGDWSCWENHQGVVRSYVDGVVYQGEGRRERIGSFGYEVGDASLGWAASLHVQTPAGPQLIRLERSSTSSGIFIRSSDDSLTSCSPVGAPGDHPEPLPRDERPSLAPLYRPFDGSGRKIRTEPDPDWHDRAAKPIVLDDSFCFEMALGSGLHGYRLTTILGDGRAAHVYKQEHDELWGVDAEWRRVELELTRDELRTLVSKLDAVRFMSLPQLYVDDGVVDGSQRTFRLHTGQGVKVVGLDNAFPEPLFELAALVSGFIDARPELASLSTPAGSQLAPLPTGHVWVRLRPDYVNDSEAPFEIRLFDRSAGGAAIAERKGVWRADDGLDPIEAALGLSSDVPIDPRHRYEVEARIVDGDRIVVGRAPAITLGWGEGADIQLSTERK